MSSERTTAVLGFALWFAFGAAMRGPADDLPARASGEEGICSLLGGYGPLAADYFWLEANHASEQRDAAATRRFITLTVAADPAPAYFWVNGARILAYDLPAWRSCAEPNAPAAMVARWRAEGAREALALLERGQTWHRDSPALWLEMAYISRHGLHDFALAAKYYREAASRPGAPTYAARLAAVMERAAAEGSL